MTTYKSKGIGQEDLMVAMHGESHVYRRCQDCSIGIPVAKATECCRCGGLGVCGPCSTRFKAVAYRWDDIRNDVTDPVARLSCGQTRICPKCGDRPDERGAIAKTESRENESSAEQNSDVVDIDGNPIIQYASLDGRIVSRSMFGEHEIAYSDTITPHPYRKVVARYGELTIEYNYKYRAVEVLGDEGCELLHCFHAGNGWCSIAFAKALNAVCMEQRRDIIANESAALSPSAGSERQDNYNNLAVTYVAKNGRLFSVSVFGKHELRKSDAYGNGPYGQAIARYGDYLIVYDRRDGSLNVIDYSGRALSKVGIEGRKYTEAFESVADFIYALRNNAVAAPASGKF